VVGRLGDWARDTSKDHTPESSQHSRLRISRMSRVVENNNAAEQFDFGSFDRNAFAEEAKPFCLPGHLERPTFLFYGGLAGTGFPWRKIAFLLHEQWDNTKEVYSLAGHDGDLSDLSKVTHHDWVKDIIQKAEQAKVTTGQPVVFFGFSTSAVAVLEAVQQRPELFGALVLAGPPLKLKNGKQALILETLERVERFVPGARTLFEKIQIPIASGITTTNYPQEYLKSSRLEKVPLSSLLSLVRLQRSANEALPGISCPVLVLQGKEDAFVSEEASQQLMLKLGSADKEIVLFEATPHPVMASFNTDSFLAVVNRWLDSIQKVEPAEKVPEQSRSGWKKIGQWLSLR